MKFRRKQKDYKKLPGQGLSLAVRTSLWQGPDHLLVLERTGYSENCRRLYYADIQALVIQVNRHRFFWGLVLAVPLLLIMAWWLSTEGEALWPARILTGCFFLIWLVNILRGPTCTCRIQTRTSEQALASLSRMRAADKMLRRIQPLIEAAQGVLTREELLARRPAESVAKPFGQVSLPVAEDPVRAQAVFHWLCAGFLLLDVLFGAVMALTPSFVKVVLADGMLVVVFLLSLMAVSFQNRGWMLAGLKTWAWTVFVFLMIKGLVLLPVSGFYVFNLSGKAGLHGMGVQVATGLLLVLSVLTGVLSAIGLLLLDRNRRGQAPLPSPPPLPRTMPPPLTGVGPG